jgi:hypothetical protein
LRFRSAYRDYHDTVVDEAIGFRLARDDRPSKP